DRRGHLGDTALMVAARRARNPLVLEMLLSAGADPTPKDDAGKTAFEYARSNGALLESGILERLAP
ncbi:MAG: ankyrin repeat domain-containing protein, partial [Spirochaetales bacterium]|nr:ankyrin repeat domain-containing protein [Spirochaetales bacterium]